MKIRKKKKKKKLLNIIIIIIMIILFIVLIYNIYKIILWQIDNNKTNDTIKELEQIEITEITNDENTQYINEPEEQEENDYWYYIKYSLIDVDFNELLKKNTDTVAWINVNNTNINYPVVQTTDNEYYLDHSYDKSYNEAGWVFLDYRNNTNLTDKNNIIYAHSRLDKSMFGSLSKVLKESWYKDKSNHIIRISTPNSNSLWQIFSVYIIKEESYYITTSFSNNTKYIEFLNTIKNRSKYDFNTTLDENDIILTLSTCYSDTERTVVHAKLIKKTN